MPRYKHGSGSVYKRGKTWWIAYYGRDGKQVCESSKTTERAEARRILQTKIGQIAEGHYTGPVADRVTFDDLTRMLLNDYQANSKHSLNMAELRVRKHLAPFFGGKKAQEITSADVQAFITKPQAAGASNAEVNRELGIVRK